MDRLLVGREYAGHLTDADLGLLASLSGDPAAARRVLNHVADRYLFPSGSPWFPLPGS